MIETVLPVDTFTFATCQNVICESGAARRLGQICEQQGFKSIMMITDPGITQLGLHRPALESFERHNIKCSTFNEIKADPPEDLVLDAVAKAKTINADAIIGFGGGSSMDVAKIIAFLAHPDCKQEITDIYGIGNAAGQRLPLLQVPTTAGTGSEVTPIAIVTTGATTKTGIVSPLFLPDTAVLDSELTLGLPKGITAATGIDSMVHAIEAFTSKLKKNPMSDMFAKQALHLLATNIRTAVHKGSDKQARQNMLLGSMMAGQAFANSPVAAVHALAYPLGGHFHIPHGLSNSLVLPEVMRFNLEKAATHYAELAPIIFPDINFTGSDIEISSLLIDHIELLIKDLELPSRLSELNIDKDFLPTLAEDAMLQSRLLINNPKEVRLEDALAIYQAAY